MGKYPDNILPFKRPPPRPTVVTSKPLDVHGTPIKWAIERAQEAAHAGEEMVLEDHEAIAYGTVDEELIECYESDYYSTWAHDLCLAREYGISDPRWYKTVVSREGPCVLCDEILAEPIPVSPALSRLPPDEQLAGRGLALAMRPPGQPDEEPTLLHPSCAYLVETPPELEDWHMGWCGPVEIVKVDPETDYCDYCGCELGELPC